MEVHLITQQQQNVDLVFKHYGMSKTPFPVDWSQKEVHERTAFCKIHAIFINVILDLLHEYIGKKSTGSIGLH